MANGMGGYSWAGFEVLAAYAGVQDPEAVIDAMRCIKQFAAEAPPAPPPAATSDDPLNLA